MSNNEKVAFAEGGVFRFQSDGTGSGTMSNEKFLAEMLLKLNEWSTRKVHTLDGIRFEASITGDVVKRLREIAEVKEPDDGSVVFSEVPEGIGYPGARRPKSSINLTYVPPNKRPFDAGSETEKCECGDVPRYSRDVKERANKVFAILPEQDNGLRAPSAYIPTVLARECECGATKTHGAIAGQMHSSWCPMHKES